MQRHSIRGAILIAAGILLSVSPGLSVESGSFSKLAGIICKLGRIGPGAGSFAAIGLHEDQMRSIRDRTRLLLMPAKQCDGEKPDEARFIVMVHRIQDEPASLAILYLTSLRGELVRAYLVRDRSDGTPTYSRFDPVARLQAKFEAEKRYWLAKYGL